MVNKAVTCRFSDTVSEHTPVPEQLPLHPEKSESLAGVAESVTRVPWMMPAVQEEPQSMKLG